jgi:hypothetical protein
MRRPLAILAVVLEGPFQMTVVSHFGWRPERRRHWCRGADLTPSLTERSIDHGRS